MDLGIRSTLGNSGRFKLPSEALIKDHVSGYGARCRDQLGANPYLAVPASPDVLL